jgi:hypothetical protein
MLREWLRTFAQIGVLRREIGAAEEKIFRSRQVSGHGQHGRLRKDAMRACKHILVARGIQKHLEKSVFEKTTDASWHGAAVHRSGSRVRATTDAKQCRGLGPGIFFAQVVDTMKKRD